MKITIVGAGEIGSYLAQVFSEEGHDLTIIENDGDLASKLEEEMNAKVICGDGVLANILIKSRINEADYLLAMTTSDAHNMLCCSIAKSLGAKNTICRIHHQTLKDFKIFDYQIHFGIDYLINPEAMNATELAKAIRNPGRLALENFARGEIEALQLVVSPHSKYIKLPLRGIQLGPNIRIGYIERNGIIEVPTAETELLAEDKIILAGPANTLDEIKDKFNPEPHKFIKKVTIFGAKETGIILAGILNIPQFQLRIIEQSKSICEELSVEFPDASIINGDATSLRLLEEEQIGDSDYFIACTKDDEDNVMTCIQVKRLGTKHVQLVINRPDYELLINEIKATMGIEVAVSARETTARELLRYISTEKYTELATLAGRNAKIIEILVPINCRYSNHKIKDIPWPKRCVIIGLLHKFRATVPNPDDVLLGEDRIVVIAMNDKINELMNLLL